ncbi:hypothetical protein [Glycomyces sp. MUSA5-2]|uniref:hypothetical protein n=1 Tax=Glycomyces sp. MUSA5-2 TaxID=2053002 RepID=UPI00300B52BD
MPDLPETEFDCRALSPASGHTIVATADDLVAVDESGAATWRYPFGSGRPLGAQRTTCTYSRDGALVWLYLPDVYAGRGAEDRLVLLDAATGALVDEAPLPVPGGHSASIDLHPDGVHVLLCVGCGQDGTYTFLARATPGSPLACEPWPADPAALGSLWLQGMFEDGSTVLAVTDDGTRIEFRTWPTGDLAWSVTLADLGYDLESGGIEPLWIGRVVPVADGRLVVVEVLGEQEDAEGNLTEYTASHGLDWPGRTVLKQAMRGHRK